MSRFCVVEGCDHTVKGYGFCSKHYQRWAKHGDPATVLPKGRKKPTVCRNGHDYDETNTRYTKEGHQVCIACSREASRQYHRTTKMEKRYGLTPEMWQAMFDEQGGACALCHRVIDYRLHVDHDHQTGRVRGLLCSKCNGALGWYEKRRQEIEGYVDGS